MLRLVVVIIITLIAVLLIMMLFRAKEKDRNKYKDGFSFEGSGLTGLKMHLMQRLKNMLPRMNSVSASKDKFLAQTKLASDNNSGFFLIISVGNSRAQQFNAGLL